MTSEQEGGQINHSKEYFFANALTMSRAGAAFASVLLSSQGQLSEALVVSSVSFAVTEFDGTIARKYGVSSKEGAIRDGIADIAMMNSFILIGALHSFSAFGRLQDVESLIFLSSVFVGYSLLMGAFVALATRNQVSGSRFQEHSTLRRHQD